MTSDNVQLQLDLNFHILYSRSLRLSSRPRTPMVLPRTPMVLLRPPRPRALQVSTHRIRDLLPKTVEPRPRCSLRPILPLRCWGDVLTECTAAVKAASDSRSAQAPLFSLSLEMVPPCDIGPNYRESHNYSCARQTNYHACVGAIAIIAVGVVIRGRRGSGAIRGRRGSGAVCWGIGW